MNREILKYPFYLIVHPFNGYWDLKYEHSKKLNLILSFVIMALLIMTNVLSSQYSGFLVNIYNPEYFNSLLEITYVVVPIIFWCIANWSLTTLMDGEGRFVEIFTSTCFALIPLIIINFPWIWLSNVISIQETAFYYFCNSAAVIWSMYLLFIGNMTVHQFSPTKTIATILLTIVAIAFMAFLCLLFFSLLQQMISFITVVYQEIAMRN
ncbi:ABC-type multidrug transport system fused ATPase/permease subunit [Paenibacillus endophyticus]|uniref:ABC-type multidrug transport system fused ATPase/permease subunit n=1 Tax=Paenibacillus endophyticus TaxID=1294268 RepID=A0A7W5C3A9_9BACL|nr:Yip1 family protein [Paenibacillus endophyticus]MBB3150453.1 ABC-type multidrug transport system fused ATPase/permease subunit [Paenibacillus endophyticus]